MADALALVIQNGQVERVGVTDAADTLLVQPGAGATGGLDVDAAGNLSIGVTNANALTVSSAGVVTTVAGDLVVSGDTQLGDATSDNLEVIASIENNTAVGNNISLLFLGTQNHVIVVNTASGAAGGTMALAAGGGDSEFAGGLVNVSGGFGGDSVGVAIGGTGGNAEISGGDGGAGDATFAAGAGGIGRVEGGDGGTAAAGGGALGGNAEVTGGAGTGAFADGQVMVGQVNTSSIIIGTSSVPTTIWASGVTTSTTGYDLNDTSVGTAGSLAVGCYDDPAWVNIAPATADLQGMLDAIDAAITGGATLQSAYAANPTITEDNTDQRVTIARGTNATNEVLALTDTTSAVAQGVLSINKTPTSGPTDGNALAITMGANANGRSIIITDAGSGATILLNKTGSTGDPVLIQRSGVGWFTIENSGIIRLGGKNTLILQPVASDTAGFDGFGASLEGGDGFPAGGGNNATAGGASAVRGGDGGDSDGTNTSAAGAQTEMVGGVGGAGNTAVAGAVGGNVRVTGGLGGDQGTTGDPGGGGGVFVVGGAAGAGGAGNAANGGGVTLTGGAAASNATGTFGGNITITGGAEGSGGTGTGGTVTINAGSGTTNNGIIQIATADTRLINSGNATDDPTWTHTGSFAVTTAAQKNPLLQLTQPTQTRATAANFAEAIQMTSTGTNAEVASVLIGADNPNDATAVSEGEIGSIFLDAATPELWQKVGTSAWERVGVTGDGLISLTGGSTTQSGVTSTPAQVTGFTANGADPDLTTPDHTSDDITLDAPGVWKVTWTVSFTGTASTIYTGKITCTGSGTVNGGTWSREILTSTSVGDATCVAIVTGAALADTVECTIECDSGTVGFTPSEMTLLVERKRRS